MSFSRDGSKSNKRRDIPLRPLKPATNFDDLLDKIDTPPPKSKRTKTVLQRASTLTRQILVGPTFDERYKGKGIAETYLANEPKHETSRESSAPTREAANERLRNLRHTVLCQGKYAREHDLWDLAKHENVYLNPPPSSMERMKKKDLAKVELAAYVVARLTSRMTEGRYKDHFIFLGRNKVLYAGENHLGTGSQPIRLEDEEVLAHVREIARAYYSLCS
ncbi:hypothetical protein F4680DRAFT_468261 [Xylaria scruposa]|nr:hypothetical protein F4680DRAFT_468261 [Xylaria scruposa]